MKIHRNLYLLTVLPKPLKVEPQDAKWCPMDLFSMHFDDFLSTFCRPTGHMRTELSLQSQFDLAGYGVSGIELFSNIFRLLFQTTTQVPPESIS